MVDLCWLGRTFPRRAVILAKKSLQYIPFLGWFMTLADNIFLIRNNKQSIRDMFKEASNIVLKKQLSVFFFPEGTRGTHEKPDLLPFKKGAFILAVLSQIPIVPIVVMDMHNVVSNKYHRFPGGKLRVKVLSPIETKGKTEEDVPALMELARECMLKTLIEISPDRVDYTKGAKPKAQ
ncbi:1-acylglycerol-3-phosphate O-acyltransferase [Spiromyces aspiralis]|uniref:1-acylglycerol-3-phosphate O-acyltransferase n=1 Tax=Spiromyces aspiralis TaxID=68401 RepID=A0ACC1HQ78_9FUNG|nr:1-acylglycerol-3-phosphate O-acyltransferase [Spiromyces aspiralis]